MKKRKLWVSIIAGLLAVIMILSLVVGVLPDLVSAKSSSQIKEELNDLKDEKEEIDQRIEELEGQLSDNLKDMEAIVEQKNIIDQQIFMLYEKMANLNEQITAYSVLIAEKQAELDTAETHLKELNRKHKERIRAMEEDGALSYWSVLFKANSFADLLDRMNMIEEIAAADQRRLREINEAAKAVAETKAELETERAQLEENKNQLATSQAELEVKRAEADELLTQLVASGEEYEKLLHQAEEEASDLEEDIKDKQDEYEEALESEKPSTGGGSSGGGGGGGSTGPNTTGGKDYYIPSDAKWLVPCKYTRFSSAFGWRIHPVYKDERFHYGVDLGGPKGTPIKATRSGKVTLAKYSSSAGYYVKIDHGDGFTSIYMHMTHYIVKKGDKVDAGEVIGYMGSTGTSTGSHLHFGITYKGKYVNPAKYIDI